MNCDRYSDHIAMKCERENSDNQHCKEVSQDFGLSTYIACSVRAGQSVSSVLLLRLHARTFLELELNKS